MDIDHVHQPFCAQGMSYHLTLTHDAPSYIWFMLAGGLLLIPPIWYTIQAKSFEARRWMDSDYAPQPAVLTKHGSRLPNSTRR